METWLALFWTETACVHPVITLPTDGYLILSSEVGVLDVDPTKNCSERTSASRKNASGRYRSGTVS